MVEPGREQAEQRSQQPEESHPDPKTQNDPPRTPTLEEQHEDEFPDASAEDIEERIADGGHADQGGHAEGRAASGSSDD